MEEILDPSSLKVVPGASILNPGSNGSPSHVGQTRLSLHPIIPEEKDACTQAQSTAGLKRSELLLREEET